jgi:hypothetical protein
VPVKLRRAKERRPSFSAETLEQFVRLERTPRRSQEFKDGSRVLARQLGLIDQWWTGNDVNDRGPPCHPDGYIANVHWAEVREVRKALLAAAGLIQTRTPTQADGGSRRMFARRPA